MTILDTIVKEKRQDIEQARQTTPVSVLEARIAGRETARGFGAALRGEGIGIIAETKKASPSKGLLCPDYDPVRLAHAYESAGASAISVLTEERHFMGSLDDLVAVRQAVSLPVLRKDFIIDSYQVYESAAAGADAILLIVAALDDATLNDLHDLTQRLGMDCLVEVHDEDEMARAGAMGASVIGINNRNLATFDVDITTTMRLYPLAPPGCTIVSESGIRTADDMKNMLECGVNAVLVGESFVTAGDIAAKFRELHV